jgi:ribosomal-protein-alanine N-acetyltransferase
MMAQVELRGRRVRLRDLCPEDCHDIFDYASDPVVTQFAGWERHNTLADSSAYIERCLDESWNPITFAVDHLAESRVIGVVDIRVISKLWGVGEIGYTLGRRYWGQGYNVEAGTLLVGYGFEVLGLRRIQAVCDTNNRRSFRTMEKLGMVRERVLERVPTRRGYVVDRFVYSILRREWERRPPLRTGGALC